MHTIIWQHMECEVQVYFIGLNKQPLIRLISTSYQHSPNGKSFDAGGLVKEITEYLPHNRLGKNITVIKELEDSQGLCDLLVTKGFIKQSGVSVSIDSRTLPVVALQDKLILDETKTE